MYTLLSGLYKYIFQRDEYCVLILGLDNAGKTVRAFHFSLCLDGTCSSTFSSPAKVEYRQVSSLVLLQ